jgi:hypothetical protein
MQGFMDLMTSGKGFMIIIMLIMLYVLWKVFLKPLWEITKKILTPFVRPLWNALVKIVKWATGAAFKKDGEESSPAEKLGKFLFFLTIGAWIYFYKEVYFILKDLWTKHREGVKPTEADNASA